MAGVVAPDAQGGGDARSSSRTCALLPPTAPDLTLLLEPINQRDKPGYFYSTLGEAADIIDDVGAPNLKIMFDVYHVGVSEGDVTKRLERHLADIGHVQIAAVPSRAEPDEGEIAYARSSPRSTGSAMPAGSAANTSRAAIPTLGWRGCGR